MDDATFALIYGVFAILFVYLNLQSLGTDIDAGIYSTVVPLYNERPYSGAGKAAKTVSDVELPAELYSWLTVSFANVTFEEQGPWPSDSPWNDVLEWNSTLTPAVVGSFNRVVLIRFTGKRWDLESNSAGAFPQSTFKRLGGGHSRLSPEGSNQDGEYQLTWCGNNSARCYEYKTAGTYNSAGGYSMFLDPLEGPESFQEKVAELAQDGFFDLRLATFVADMMVYNANVDVFMHFAWKFSFNIAGNCFKATHSQKVSLTKNLQETLNILRIFLGLMVVFFLIIEVRKMSIVGLRNHFKKIGSFVDMLSLITCTFSLLSYVFTKMHSIHGKFSFEALLDPSTREATFDGMEDLGRLVEDQSYIVGLNLLIVFVRAICLVAALQSNLGLILRVLDLSFNNLLYFTGMFVLIQVSFVGMAYYTFGAGFEGMSSFANSFYRCFSMMTGKPIYNDLMKADPIMGPIFYFTFYILFYLIMLNMFVSILLNGYDIVDHDIANRKDLEINPLWRIFVSLNKDVVGRCFHVASATWSFLVGTCAPIIEGSRDSAKSLMPPMPGFVTKRFKTKRPPAEDGMHGTPSSTEMAPRRNAAKARLGVGHKIPGASGQAKIKKWMFIRECLLLMLFMINFVAFAILLTRGEPTYWVGQATLDRPMSLVRQESQPPTAIGFEEVQSMYEVKDWAQQMLDQLYSDARCAIKEADGSIRMHPVDSEAGKTCDNSLDHHQLVQRVASWNTGFLNTTFVRLSVQPACYLPNLVEEWRVGAPGYRATPGTADCSTTSCIDVFFQEEQCRTANGISLDPASLSELYVGSTINVNDSSDGTATATTTTATGAANLTGSASDLGGSTPHFGLVRSTAGLNFSNLSGAVKFNFSQPKSALGPIGLHGGFAFSFGTARDDAVAMLGHVAEGGWFSRNSAAMVFDWVTYNGNLDRFTHSSVSFSLLGTGEFVKTSRSQTFPLNIARGGGYDPSGCTAVLILFFVYAFLVAYYLAQYILSMRKEMEQFDTFSMFFCSFFTDPWNVSDLVSLCLSTIAIFFLMNFAFFPFRQEFKFSLTALDKYQVPNRDVKMYDMPKEVDPARGLVDDWYIFAQFEHLANVFRTCLTIAALNSFFISIKVLKYVNMLPRVRPFSDTLNQGKTRNFYFAVIMSMAMVGFSLFFHVIFGRSATGFSTFAETMLTIFTWVIGVYDLETLFEINHVTALIAFVAFMVFFYFIAVNMFLATMVNKYSQTVGDLDIKATIARLEAEKTVRVIDYASKEDFFIDVTLTQTDEADVTVQNLKDGGPAAKAGVGAGHSVFKINRNKDSWRRNTLEKTKHDGIQPDDEGHLLVTFKDTRRNRKGFGFGWRQQQASHHDAIYAVRPTVKNFWSTQGAIARVSHRTIFGDKAGKKGHGASSTDGIAEEQEEEEEGARAGDGSSSSSSQESDGSDDPVKKLKLRKKKTRKKLEPLLFSRWLQGRRDGLDGTGVAPGRFWEQVPKATDDVDAGWDNLDDAAPVEDGAFQPNDWDVDDLGKLMDDLPIYGHEVWLDTLVVAYEKEMAEGESLVAEMLRVPELRESEEREPGQRTVQKPLIEFYRQSSEVLKLLETKALKKYFQSLRRESEDRQEILRKQNAVLYDYVQELEDRFRSENTERFGHKSEKGGLISRFAMALDPCDYADLSPRGGPGSPSMAEQVGAAAAGVAEHLKKLTMPWRGATMSRKDAEAAEHALKFEDDNRPHRK